MVTRVKNFLRVDGIKSFYTTYERHISSLTLILGFAFDNYAVKETVIATQSLIFAFYLVVAGACILVLHLIETRYQRDAGYPKLHFWMMLLLQFALGSLFSMFFVFYARGVSFETSWPFLLFLFANLIGNEVFKKWYARVGVQIPLLFAVLFSFLIYFVPVVTHSIGTASFLASGALSLLVMIVFVRFLRRVANSRIKNDQITMWAGIVLVFGLINTLYFTNMIPPVPLVMKHGGVYHSFQKDGDKYVVDKETKSLSELFSMYPVFHHAQYDPVYIVTAVYAPVDLKETIVHDWQYFDTDSQAWVSVMQIPVSIVGGREEGYRSFSYKYAVFPARWRVDIKTSEGKIIGRIKFELVEDGTTPTTVEETF